MIDILDTPSQVDKLAQGEIVTAGRALLQVKKLIENGRELLYFITTSSIEGSRRLNNEFDRLMATSTRENPELTGYSTFVRHLRRESDGQTCFEPGELKSMLYRGDWQIS